MILNSEDRLYDTFDQVKIPEKRTIKAPDPNVFEVEAGKAQEDFLIEQLPDIPDPAIAYPSLPAGEIHALEPLPYGPPARESYPIETTKKNFIDLFFDWLNGVLSRIL